MRNARSIVFRALLGLCLLWPWKANAFSVVKPSSWPTRGQKLAATTRDDTTTSVGQEEQKVKKAANPWYGVGRIQNALKSPDDLRLTPEQNTERRKRKVDAWEKALSNAWEGSLNWGDRQAVVDVPVWATPVVLDGGFVSGELVAKLDDGDKPNDYYLTMEGLMELDRMLETGCYRIPVPEHGALLMVAWLLDNGQMEEAGSLLQEIKPYFDRIRFYPDLANTPHPSYRPTRHRCRFQRSRMSLKTFKVCFGMKITSAFPEAKRRSQTGGHLQTGFH